MLSRIFLSPPHMNGGEVKLIHDAFASNWIAPFGPMVKLFESKIAEMTNIDHVVAVSSGTAALHLALLSLDIGSGDSVWVSSFTFIGGVAPILYVQAKPVFFDIDDDLMIDINQLENELRKANIYGRLPKAIITTDSYGSIPDINRMRRLSEEYGFAWISDSAASMGSRRYGVHAGKGAKISIFSFNGNKIITTSGGGAFASDDAELVDFARYLANHAREKFTHCEHHRYGFNYQFSNINAAIGLGQLDTLYERVARRRQIFEYYRNTLGSLHGFSFCTESPSSLPNRWLSTVFINEKISGISSENVRLALDKNNIESRPVWKPMHMQTMFMSAPMIGGSKSELAFERGLCLPSGSAMSDSDLNRVVETIYNLYQLVKH